MNVLLRLFRLGVRIDGRLEQMVFLLRAIQKQQLAGVSTDGDEELLHAADVKQWLGISDTTLYRYKKNKILVPTGIDGKFYRKSDIIKAKQSGFEGE